MRLLTSVETSYQVTNLKSMTVATGTASSMHEFSKPARLPNRQFLSYIANPQGM